MKKRLVQSMWLSTLAAGVFALAVTGCGGPGSTPTGGVAPEEEETEEYIAGEEEMQNDAEAESE